MADYQTMLISLRESQTVATKREAGMILAAGGWAVFPVPNNQKFDAGKFGLSYLSATQDPARFHDMAEQVMFRHECHDVNIALCPGKCAVPLIVVDLDGVEAMWRFFNDAGENGNGDHVGDWLRVNTTRADLGRHMYFVAPDGKQWANSIHIWGGDVRSGRGHVVMPPSTTETGRYTWAGERLPYAPAWVMEGLHGSAVGNATRDGEKSDEEINDLLEELSQWNCDSYGRKALNNMLEELNEARAGDQQGGRNPMLSKSINRIMDLAVERRLNALEAINEIADMYVSLFSVDEGRNPAQEVIRCVRSWFRNHDTVAVDVEAANAVQDWANQRGGGAVQTLPDVQGLPEDQDDTGTARVRKPRRRGKDWKSAVNK